VDHLVNPYFYFFDLVKSLQTDLAMILTLSFKRGIENGHELLLSKLFGLVSVIAIENIVGSFLSKFAVDFLYQIEKLILIN